MHSSHPSNGLLCILASSSERRTVQEMEAIALQAGDRAVISRHLRDVRALPMARRLEVIHNLPLTLLRTDE